jgi:cytoskeletal protein RodZ
MNSSTNKLVRTISEFTPDEMPAFSSINNNNISANASSESFMDFFSNLTWQTWLIVILILAFLGINVFSYLEAGTEKTASIFDKIFAPILKLFGYEALETTKQTVETSATGTKAGVDVVSGTTTSAINVIEDTAKGNNNATNTSVTGQQTTNTTFKSSQPIKDQLKIEKQINELEDWQQQNLQKALTDASRPSEVKPDDSLSRIQSGGSNKAGWCFIGEDRGFRTCSEIGQNDQCMSGDIFPSQEICMNPNLRP